MIRELDYGLSPAQFHSGLDKLWNALGEEYTGPQDVDVFTLCADKIDRLQAIIDDLLKACKLTTNICEIVGPSPGALTPKHRVLAQKYAAIGRAAIAKAEGQEEVDRE